MRSRGTIGETDPFAYWDGGDHSLLAEFLAEWRASFPQTRVLGDDDVVPQLELIAPGYVSLYRRIRLPAARSDIARLVALHAFGGLYVDCHCGLRDPDQLRTVFRLLADVELVLWQRSFRRAPRPANEIKPVNGAILARPGSPAVRDVLLQALANVAAHDEQEAAQGRIGYSVWQMTGAGMYRRVLHEPGTQNTRLRPEYEGRIGFASEDDGPIQFYRHRRYRSDPDRHWSERQKNELLLTPRSPAP